MPWGRMDDKFHRNRKVRELRRRKGGREALGTWVYWWSWCLDEPDLVGFVPADELPPADAKTAPLLVEVGLWDEVEGGYQFHDFGEYNPTRDQVDAKRRADRERVASKRGASREDVACDIPCDTPATITRVASTRRAPASQPLPNPTQSQEERERTRARVHDPPISDTAGRALSRLQETLGATWDLRSWLAELERIAGKPESEFVRVLAALAADSWVREKPARANPGHVIKHWAKYLTPDPPRRLRDAADETPVVNRYINREADAQMRRDLGKNHG